MNKISGRIVDVIKGEIFPGKIHIKGNKIYKIERAETVREECLILPGLVDSHIHIESSMLTPSRFAEAVIPHGTVATVSDPHEIANVLGVEGVEFMIENANTVPLKVYFGAPSCVPATSFETSGAIIDSEKVGSLLSRPEIKYLSEMMNYPGVVHGEEEVKNKILWAHHYGKPIDGHAPGLGGADLDKYIASGVSTDHECSFLSEAIEKIQRGMIIQIREGSAARNFENLHLLIDDYPERVMLCSDDLHPDQLTRGHINCIVKRALKKGLDPMNVLRTVTLNPVRFYNLDVGLLQEGDPADFIIIDNLDDFNVIESYIDGNKAFGQGKNYFETASSCSPNNYFPNVPSLDEIKIKDQGKNIKIIKAIDGELFTQTMIGKPNSRNGYLESDVDKDILKLIVQNRYKKEKPALGFINNFGIKEGGMISTIAHDSHNIICLGTNDDIILELISWVNNQRGGIAFHDGSKITGLPLPVAGILTDRPAEEVANIYGELERAVKKAGSVLKAPFMTLSFMSLLVIPELKLGNRGLFDVKDFTFTDLYSD